MTKKKKKQKKKSEPKPKLKTKAVLDKNLARVLSLTLGKMTTYRISNIYYNAKEKELVATDSRNLIIVKIKPTGIFSKEMNLEEGFYDIAGNMLIKNDEKQKLKFPEYKKAIPKEPKAVCEGNILYGLLDCMVENQIRLDIWKKQTVLRALDKLSSFWKFANNSSKEAILMETENSNYIIKYVMMPWPPPFTTLCNK